MLNLTPAEERIVNKLSHDGGDVAVKVLFRCLRGRWPLPEETPRRQQQYVGAPICRANAKLRKEKRRIVPGVKRGTYRLAKI